MGLAPQYHGQLHFTRLSKHDTIEKELLWHKSACVCVLTQSVLCASSGFNARLPLFVAVNILANHFYFGMEIIP